MFGRATIRLGIGPHSSYIYSCDALQIFPEEMHFYHIRDCSNINLQYGLYFEVCAL